MQVNIIDWLGTINFSLSCGCFNQNVSVFVWPFIWRLGKNVEEYPGGVFIKSLYLGPLGISQTFKRHKFTPNDFTA